MLNENDPNYLPGTGPRRYKPALPPVTKDELELLILKRYVSKQDVMRIFDLRDTDFHDKVRSGHIVTCFLGKTKRYYLNEIYRQL